MDYPTSAEVEKCLKFIAVEVGDLSAKPFRVDLLSVSGGKPPMYTVVILSPAKEKLRQGLGELLDRSFSLGVGSFMLKGPEAVVLVSKYGHAE
ncbi:MAG: hypothetical protein ABI612_25040 [Betaproteobacteria bacterium]